MLDYITDFAPTVLYTLLFAVDYHAASTLSICASPSTARHFKSAAVIHALLAAHYWPSF